MTRLTPHPGYRLTWLILHGAAFVVWLGLVLTGRDATWPVVVYIGLVALVEAVSLARRLKGRLADGTFSWTTWAFLDDGTGATAFWRLLIVALWVFWFVGLWLYYVPLPDLVKGLAFLGFTPSWDHFFGREARKRRRARTVRTAHHPGGGGTDRDELDIDPETGPTVR